MGNRADYRSAESLNRSTQHLTQAELHRLTELLSVMTDDGEQ